MKDSENHLIFLSIINGFSFSYSNGVEFYIKHPSKFETLDSEKEYIKHLKIAQEKKIPTYEQRESEIINDGVFSKKENESIKNDRLLIEHMREQISQSYLFSKRKIFKKEISEAINRIDKLMVKKNILIGRTAEQFANERLLYYKIFNNTYKDQNFKHKYFEVEPEQEEYNEFVNLYKKEINKINGESIKNIALSSYFISMYNMCGDNAYFFYGKPIIHLTDFQSDLFIYGKYFKDLMSRYGGEIPDEMKEKPDDIIEWFEIKQNVDKFKVLEGDGDDNKNASTIVGATKEDLKIMGVIPAQMANMSEIMAKKGKTVLSKDDLYNMDS